MKHLSLIFISIALLLSSNLSIAKDNPAKKTYEEMAFIQVVNGKTREEVQKILGDPVRKTTPVMPTNAAQIVQENAKIDTPRKKDAIEMWHYNNLVTYHANKTYKRTELTFINDKCSNITYTNTH